MTHRARTLGDRATGGQDHGRAPRNGRLAPMAVAVIAVAIGLVAIGARLGPRPAGAGPSGSPGGSPGASVAEASVSGSATPSDTPDPSLDAGQTVAVSSVGPRSGVPAALRSRTWLAEIADNSPDNERGAVAVAGVEGTTARIVLPRAEIGLAADGERIASAVVGPDGSELYVRNVSTGAIEGQLHTSVVVNHGLLIASRVFWAGFADPTRQTDGGLWMADLSAAEPAPQLLAGPVTDQRPLGPNAERGPLLASASGRTIASTIGGLKGVQLDVIDLATLQPRASPDGVIPLALTDEALLALRAGGLEFRDLATGKPRWSIRADLVYDVVADPAARGAVLAVDLGREYVIEEVDFSTGKVRKLLTQTRDADTRYLVSALSTFDQLVLLDQPSLGEALRTPTGQATAGLLDRTSAAFMAVAFKVGAP
jgi:hypothetical protein